MNKISVRVDNRITMRRLWILPVIAILFATLAGCGESSLHSTDSNYRWYNSEIPLLSITRQHFGGGQALPDGQISYPWGFRLENVSSNGTAESVRLLLRIRRGDLDWDDHVFQFGDIDPKSTRDFSGEVSVIRDYTTSQAILIWQQNGQINQADLRQNNAFLEDSDLLRY